MNWSKAKSISILFLLTLNFILLIVTTYSNNDNSLSFESEKAIIKLLNQNGINLLGEIPKNFSPMPTISLAYNDTDIDELKNIFFGKEENIKRSVELGSTILRKDKQTLTINNSGIRYVNEDYENDIQGLEKADAEKIAEQFVKTKLKTEYPKYSFHSSGVINNKYILKYYEDYGGYKLYSNYIRFDITNKGIKAVEIVSYEPTSVIGMDRDICSADEALLTFLYKMRNKIGNTDIFINKIELGYVLEENGQKGVDGRAVPCYRISIKDNNELYYINAYNNELLYIKTNM